LQTDSSQHRTTAALTSQRLRWSLKEAGCSSTTGFDLQLQYHNHSKQQSISKQSQSKQDMTLQLLIFKLLSPTLKKSWYSSMTDTLQHTKMSTLPIAANKD
jgi:hypothetical protein